MEIAPPLTPDILARLPVFPLPNLVFFPGTILPLHLFEPRYRALALHCTGDGPAAMAVAPLRPDLPLTADGQPAYSTLAGAGRVVGHRANADGTHDILLAGTDVVSLEELGTEHPFREARATIAADTDAEKLRPADEMALRAMVAELAAMARKRNADFDFGIPIDAGPGIVADVVAHALVADPASRQRLLELRSLPGRVEAVTDAVAAVIGELAEHGDGAN